MPLIFTVVLGGLLIGFALWGHHRRQQLLKTIEVIVLKDVASSQLGNQRDITVYLPPRYRESETHRFDVLYIALMASTTGNRIALVAGGMAPTTPRMIAVAQAIDAFWGDRARARRMGEAGLERYRSLGITWDCVVERLVGAK